MDLQHPFKLSMPKSQSQIGYSSYKSHIVSLISISALLFTFPISNTLFGIEGIRTAPSVFTVEKGEEGFRKGLQQTSDTKPLSI